MSNLIKDGISWLDGQRVEHLSDVVIYSRDGYPPLSIAATQGQSSRDIVDESGQTMESNAVDWLVSSGSLRLSGVLVTPMIGDKITLTEADGTVKTFDVLDLEGFGHYRWADSRGLILRIHTKLTEQVNP